MKVSWTADDWGISPGVNLGIVELVRLGVLTRVSMLATTDYISTHLEELLASTAETGLHFNLTYARSLGNGYRWLVGGDGNFHSPAKLFVLWQVPGIRKVLAEEIENELYLQLARLESRKVDVRYFDSHHHAHMLPGLMKHLKNALTQYNIDTVRLPLDPALKWTAQAPIYWLAKWNAKAFHSLGFRSLPFVYPGLEDLFDLSKLQARFDRKASPEVIVHPAKEMDFQELNIADTYRAGRLLEFEALKSFAQ